MVTGEGFVEITGETISVLTDFALESEKIDKKSAEKAQKRAKEALKQKHTVSTEEFARTAAELQKALASLKVKRHHHQKNI